MPSEGFSCYCSRKHLWEQYCAMVVNAPDWESTRRIMVDHHSGAGAVLRSELRRTIARLENQIPPRPRHTHHGLRVRQWTLRARLHRADPHCFWCGQITVLESMQRGHSGNLATVDHLYSRLHPERTKRYRSALDSRHVLHVLACFDCNCERGTLEQQGRIFVPKLQEREEFARLCDATIARNVSDHST